MAREKGFGVFEFEAYETGNLLPGDLLPSKLLFSGFFHWLNARSCFTISYEGGRRVWNMEYSKRSVEGALAKLIGSWLSCCDKFLSEYCNYLSELVHFKNGIVT